MSGFANSILGGMSKLIRAAIQSPNFVHTLTGWSINKDGTAEFQNITARGVISANSISNTPIGSSTITSSDFQGGTMEETKITFDSIGGVLFIYAASATTTTVTATGAGTFTAPAGVTTLDVKAWAGGGGGGWGGNGGGLTYGGTGAGGGEFAEETSLAVTPGNVYNYNVGVGGTGGTLGNGGFSTAGGNTTFTGDSVTVTANGGQPGVNTGTGTDVGGLGGTGSTNTIHFNGGNGGDNLTNGGGGAGGGSSAGTGSSGNHGNPPTGGGFTNTGGTKGATVTNGGAATAGGNGVLPGTSAGGNASNASQPGGGAGGGGATDGSTPGNGGNGGAGKLSISYQSGRVLIGVIAPASGTDSFSTAYPQGIAGIHAGTDYVSLNDNGVNAALLFGASGAASDISLTRSAAGKLLFTGTEIDVPASSGPFITGESFHTISNGTNFTGTMRVKKMPWNAIWIDVQIVYSATAATTTNFGTLPDSSYYPTGNRQLILSCTQVPTAVSQQPRVFIPGTSGNVQVVIPQALGAANAQLSLSVMYPTN